jgi:hypothetical protein
MTETLNVVLMEHGRELPVPCTPNWLTGRLGQCWPLPGPG